METLKKETPVIKIRKHTLRSVPRVASREELFAQLNVEVTLRESKAIEYALRGQEFRAALESIDQNEPGNRPSGKGVIVTLLNFAEGYPTPSQKERKLIAQTSFGGTVEWGLREDAGERLNLSKARFVYLDLVRELTVRLSELKVSTLMERRWREEKKRKLVSVAFQKAKEDLRCNGVSLIATLVHQNVTWGLMKYEILSISSELWADALDLQAEVQALREKALRAEQSLMVVSNDEVAQAGAQTEVALERPHEVGRALLLWIDRVEAPLVG